MWYDGKRGIWVISQLYHFGDRVNNVDFIRLAVSVKGKTLNLALELESLR